MHYSPMKHLNFQSHFSHRQALELLRISSSSYLLSSCTDSELTTKIGDRSEPLSQTAHNILKFGHAIRHY
jgi:hypothetical protein